MAKAIRNVFKIDTLSLVECNDGYYLYDTVVGMNISMRAKTEQDACIQALLYYQRSLTGMMISGVLALRLTNGNMKWLPCKTFQI